MVREAPGSTLGYALLGLLHAGPQSGYGLRRTFVTTPLAVFSDSPGAIYPALRRLARQGCQGQRQSRQPLLYLPPHPPPPQRRYRPGASRAPW